MCSSIHFNLNKIVVVENKLILLHMSHFYLNTNLTWLSVLKSSTGIILSKDYSNAKNNEGRCFVSLNNEWKA